jgi:hypothetical protein
MRCPYCRPTSGPFVPTLEQVAEAARRLPNPRRDGPPVIRVAAQTHIRFSMLACECTTARAEELSVLTFELRSDVDEYGSRFVRWMYSGGVRV